MPLERGLLSSRLALRKVLSSRLALRKVLSSRLALRKVLSGCFSELNDSTGQTLTIFSDVCLYKQSRLIVFSLNHLLVKRMPLEWFYQLWEKAIQFAFFISLRHVCTLDLLVIPFHLFSLHPFVGNLFDYSQ